MARVAFLGTPSAAVPTLRLLAERHEVVLVVTQPDRPKGRSGTPSPPPVKRFATEQGLTVAQPENREQLAASLVEATPLDVGVVVAYGRILRPEVLEAAAHGMLNVHFSLLPRWRGAAPVARALMAGDPMTGVTIMKLDEGLDTGPVLTAQAIDIPSADNAGDLTDRLARLGARLAVDTLPGYLDGEIEAVPQSDDGLTYAQKLGAADRPIDPGSKVAEVVAQVRGLAPSPAATLEIDGERHKIYEVRPVEAHLEPGVWVAVEGRLLVGFPDGSLELVTLQEPGRKPITGKDWINAAETDNGIVG